MVGEKDEFVDVKAAGRNRACGRRTAGWRSIRQAYSGLCQGYRRVFRRRPGSVSDRQSACCAADLASLLKILRLSPGVTLAVSQPAFFQHLAEWLGKKAKAVVKLNLLRITRVVCDNHPDRAGLVERFGLAEIVDRLAHQDEAVLVREMAKEISPVLRYGTAQAQIAKARSPTFLRRTASESVALSGETRPVPASRPERPKHKRKLSRNQLRLVFEQAELTSQGHALDARPERPASDGAADYNKARNVKCNVMMHMQCSCDDI